MGHQTLSAWAQSKRYIYPFTVAIASVSTTHQSNQLNQLLFSNQPILINHVSYVSTSFLTVCSLLTELSSHLTEEKDQGNVIRGLKAAINNPNVSEEAKQRDRERLEEMGQDVPGSKGRSTGSSGSTEASGHDSTGRPEGTSESLSSWIVLS